MIHRQIPRRPDRATNRRPPGLRTATARFAGALLATLACLGFAVASALPGMAAAQQQADDPPDPERPAATAYPTVVIADYVLGCMAANGNSYIALQQCSCSIDYIAARMPYADYERASTVMQVQLDRGQRGLFYRDSNWAKRHVEQLENLQAQSTLECF